MNVTNVGVWEELERVCACVCMCVGRVGMSVCV